MRILPKLTIFMAALFIMCSLPSSKDQVKTSQTAEMLSLDNGIIAVQFNKVNNSFLIKNKDLTFAEFTNPVSDLQTSQITDWKNPVWPGSKSIELQTKSGDIHKLVVIPDFPFMLMEIFLKNQTTAIDTIHSYHLPKFTVKLDEDVTKLRAFGTFGVDSVDNNEGSYSFMSIVEPQSRNGVVAGWLTHERGSGILFSDIENNQSNICPRIDYGNLLIRPDKSANLETFMIGYFPDARFGLEAYADAIQKNLDIHLPPQPVYYCTWHHAHASNEKDIIENSKFVKENLSQFGFSAMQIDDFWQDGEKTNGPRKNFTTHKKDGPYPSGMKKTAEAISALGLTPGIWFMPFTGTWDDPFFADKKEIFAQINGEPFRTYWGGDCFDLTNPKTQDYLRSVVDRIANEWGYKYFKMDGLWTGTVTRHIYINTGYKDDELGKVTLFNPDMTQIEAYRKGLQIVRETAGDSVYLLGCNAAQNMRTLGASFGILDAMRVGADNAEKWDRMLLGAFSGNNLYFLHGKIWHNDPDPVHVDPKLPLHEAQTLLSWVAVSGQLMGSSNDYASLPIERLDLLKRAMPSHQATARPVDLFERQISRIWLLSDDESGVERQVIGLFNWENDAPIDINYNLSRIGLSDTTTYVGFDYWANEFTAPFQGKLKAHLPARTCRVLAVRPVSDTPGVISTSRHLTQGVIDILEEKWNEEQHILSGKSKIVGKDPYELRIVAEKSTGAWTIDKVVISEEDKNAGVTISLLSKNEDKIRVLISSPESRTVNWQVKFE